MKRLVCLMLFSRDRKNETKEVCEKLDSILNNSASSSLELAYLLSAVKEQGIYRDLGYTSFGKWIDDRSHGSVSKPHAYALARIGTAFHQQYDRILILFKKGKLTLKNLIKYSTYVTQGAYTAGEILNLIETDSPIDLPPSEQEAVAQEAYVRVPNAVVPSGDLAMVNKGLIKYAIKNQLKTTRDVIRAFGIDEALDETYQQMLPVSTRGFLVQLVEEGRYVCALCNKIPTEPTLHHIVPRQRGHGYGPRALLCLHPCHDATVQPRWQHYAGRVWRIDWKLIINQVDNMLKEGKDIPQEPTELVTGTLGADL